jgi:hypothetical protein
VGSTHVMYIHILVRKFLAISKKFQLFFLEYIYFFGLLHTCAHTPTHYLPVTISTCISTCIYLFRKRITVLRYIHVVHVHVCSTTYHVGGGGGGGARLLLSAPLTRRPALPALEKVVISIALLLLPLRLKVELLLLSLPSLLLALPLIISTSSSLLVSSELASDSASVPPASKCLDEVLF